MRVEEESDRRGFADNRQIYFSVDECAGGYRVHGGWYRQAVVASAKQYAEFYEGLDGAPDGLWGERGDRSDALE